MCACPKAHLRLETPPLYSLPLSTSATVVAAPRDFTSKQISDTSCAVFYSRGQRPLASQSLLSAGVSHVASRVPACPQHTPSAHAHAHARPARDGPFGLPRASASVPAVTPGPAPAERLPEVAVPEPGARLRAVPGCAGAWSPGGRARRGDSVPGRGRTLTRAARSGVRRGDDGGAAAPSAAAGTAVEPATTRGGSRGRPGGG